jgi:hypothetical protein
VLYRLAAFMQSTRLLTYNGRQLQTSVLDR